MTLRLPLFVASLVFVAGIARGHEFWVEPLQTGVQVGARVEFRLFVGDGFPGEPYSRNPRHLERFELIGPDGIRPLIGHRGSEPAGAARVDEPGVHVAVYRSRATRITLSADTFNAYLADEGLDHVLRLRAERGEETRPGRERYSRCAKTLFAVGESSGEGFDRETGLALELIPRDDPLALKPGDALRIQALFHGKPIEGLTLHVFAHGHEGPTQRIRTDSRGMARVRVEGPGGWMASAVHMQESRHADSDWESVWSSLTFE